MRPEFDLQGLKAVKPWEYALRFAFGGAVSVATTLVAKAYGPEIGGLFLGFPSIFPAALTLVKKHDGRAKAADDARGARMGSAGMIAFALVVHSTALSWPPALTLAMGVAAWLAVSVGLWSLIYGREPQPRA